MTVTLIKPRHATRLFNAGQRCWLLFRSGDGSIRVIGKHRGKGRYIRAWLRDGHYDANQIDVSEQFARRLELAP